MTGLRYMDTDIRSVKQISMQRVEVLVGTLPISIPLDTEPEDYAGECVSDFLREQGYVRVTIVHVSYIGKGYFNVLARASR